MPQTEKVQFICQVVSRTKKAVKWLVKTQIVFVDEHGNAQASALSLLRWDEILLRANQHGVLQQEVEKKYPVRRTGELGWIVTDAEDKSLLRDAILAVSEDWGCGPLNIIIQIF